MKKNEYVFNADHAVLVIHTSEKTYNFTIDLDDVDLCKQHQWSIASRYITKRTKEEKVYAQSRNTSQYLHRFLMNPGQMLVDHIDQNPQNCSRSNLRLATHADNSRNTNALGIWFSSRTNRYVACVCFEGKEREKHQFTTLDAAWLHRRALEQKYFGGTNKALTPSNAAKLKFGI